MRVESVIPMYLYLDVDGSLISYQVEIISTFSVVTFSVVMHELITWNMK